MNSIKEMRAEFAARAEMAGLRIDCPMDGAINSQIAIIAEAPGEHEVQRKTPLIGASGQLLWRHLQPHKIMRKDVYITNVSKRRTAFESGKKAMNGHERDLWAGMLNWELSQLPNLRYILVLGGVGLEALIGKSGIMSWRGSIIEHEINGRPVQLMIANNPAMCIREPKTEVSFVFDLAKFARMVAGKHKPHVISPIINPSVSDALSYIDHLDHSHEPIAYDIEVISEETACVGLANNSHEGMCISFRSFNQNTYAADDEIRIRRRLQELFQSDDTRLIAQNGMFDMTWLWYKDKIKVKRNYFDTMLAHHCLYPQLPHNLGYLTTQYTTHPYYKDEKTNWREGGNIDEFWIYNVKDACITHAVYQRELIELQNQKLDKFFFDHIMHLQPHLALMTVGGIKMDMKLKQQISETLHEEVGRKLAIFHDSVKEVTGNDTYEPNPNSPAQMSDLYFNKLKLVGRGTSTDAENRIRMYKHPRTPDAARKIIDAHGSYAKDKKFLSTYADMRVDPDGRIRCEYKQTGVISAPGRLSSAGVLWGSGMNLQNQTARSHPMFIADEGYTFGYFDLSQAEARYVGWDAKIEKWIVDFERARLDGSFDCHRSLASEMFGVPYDEVPTADRDDSGAITIRFTAKRCRHGLNYRMAADRLATTTGLPLQEAMIAYTKYHRITPELRIWWSNLEQEARKRKCLYNSFGRRLMIMERITPEALESIVAFRPQSTIGDKVSQVIYRSHEDDRWPINARVALNVHDALICLAPVEKVKTCLSIMKKYAEEPIIVRADMPPMIIPADLGIAQPASWDDEQNKWVDDPNGVPRWSSIQKVKGIEAAK